MTLRRPLLASVAAPILLACLAGCGAHAPSEDVASTDDELRTSYGDLVETLEGDDLDRWIAIRWVNVSTTRVSRCAWTFAAADLSVDSRGRLAARTTTKRCTFEVGATATALTSALAGEDPLRAPLPNRATSIYDALVGCL